MDQSLSRPLHRRRGRPRAGRPRHRRRRSARRHHRRSDAHRRRDCRRPHRRHARDATKAAAHRRARPLLRAGLHRHASARRILAGHAARIRSLRPAARRRPRRSAIRTRSPTCSALDGIRYFLAAAERTVMDLRVNLSSCVPATRFETSGAELSAADLVTLRDHPKVIGLAEMMNYPGVHRARPRRARQARRLPGRPYRRPRAAPLAAAT